ncbi:OmpA family protein [Stutzerimonas urumqiensis]|uniref:OmpA family protein n=1 Tax=Stutzerimonas urumqiensis TaxID=638269 RepID=UPI003BAA1070
MKLLKSATLILCMTVSGCSFNDKQETAEAPKLPEPVAAKVDAAWLDAYETKLRAALEDSKFEVERRDDTLIVTAPADATFNPDRPGMLLPITLGPISRVAKLVEDDLEAAVLVVGHADSTGGDEANRVLSRERAGAVAAIFRLSGLKRDRLVIKGLGSDMPRAENDTAEGRAKNRRVEMVLTAQAVLPALAAQYAQPVPATQVVAAKTEE